LPATSNLAQAQVSGPVLFGGLSGVVYGWLAFAWVAGRLNPRWRAMVPASPIMLFMVGWLLVCVTGVIDVLGFSVANAAHVGGLAAGALLGAVFGLAHRVGD
jgi:GlpG protein